MNINHNTNISLFSARESALYYDHVIPLNLGVDLLWIGEPQDYSGVKVFPDELLSIIPESFKYYGNMERIIEVNESLWQVILRHLELSVELPIKGSTIDILVEEKVLDEAIQSVQKFIHDFDLSSCAVDYFSQRRQSENGDPSDDNSSVMLTLSSLNLVDVRRTSWDQILEFRKSKESVSRLRRLRLFAIENYKNHNASYIEDDIYQRIDDYSQTVEEWGFETRSSVLTAVLSSKLIAGGFAGSIASVLLGEPVAAFLAGVGGTVAEFSSIGLNIKKRNLEMRKMIRENPIVYLHDAKTELEPDFPKESKGNE